MKMKQKGASAIHFQVEVALAGIRAGREEELDAAVAADALLMPGGHCPDISVLYPEHQK